MELLYSSINEFEDLAGTELLIPRRRIRVRKYYQPADKARCLVGGLLFVAAFGVDASMTVEHGPHGKPYLPGSRQYFNLSHSGDYVVLARADSEVGVDIEEIRSFSEDIAKRSFTQGELDWLRARSDEEKAFYTLWTGKESIMKATGMGFALAPHQFSILPIVRGQHEVNGASWYLNWRLMDSHIICAATARQPSEITMRYMDRQSLLRAAREQA